ncbi:VTC domain-containing protein [Candidatus Woesearchaeota archaeon]|nr:VTC domain-containing protein [Candidatus Woesearchaeota archaeon]
MREEIRRVIFPDWVDRFTSFLKERGYKEIEYSARPYTQTIYFNNDRFSLPFQTSLKLRRYSRSSLDSIRLSLDEQYIFEEKSSFYKGKRFLRQKRRDNLSGVEALQRFNELSLSALLDCPPNIAGLFQNVRLQPQVATQYHRRHFVLNGEDGIRITVDKDLSYFSFDGGLEASKMAKEDIVIIELKLNDLAKRGDLERVLGELDREGALPTISKKCSSFNKLSLRRRSGVADKLPLINEVPNQEYEVKFDVDRIDPSTMFLLLRHILEAKQGGFVISPGYTYSDENGAINVYYRNRHENYKVTYAGDVFKVSKKSDVESGGGVLVRKESRTKFRKFSSPEDLREDFGEIVGKLYRIKKAFWVLNQGSNRVYQVVVDKSYSYTTTDSLSQVELEYTGRVGGRASQSANGEIQSELSRLKEILCGSELTSPFLKQSTLTKFEWLFGLSPNTHIQQT